MLVRHHIAKSDFINQYYRVHKQPEEAKDPDNFIEELDKQVEDLAPPNNSDGASLKEFTAA